MKALDIYRESLAPQQTSAQVAHEDAKATLSLIRAPAFAIANSDGYKLIAEVLREAKHKFKVLDEERKVSVTPLNDEVKRVNDWYRPALDALKVITDTSMRLMGAYDAKQRAEEARLLAEAQAVAQKVLAEQAEKVLMGATESLPTAAVMSATLGLVTQAQATAPPKVEGVSAPKPKWVIKSVNEETLIASEPVAYAGVRRFTKVVVDMDALKVWIAEHGDKDVPPGVEVTLETTYTVRARR